MNWAYSCILWIKTWIASIDDFYEVSSPFGISFTCYVKKTQLRVFGLAAISPATCNTATDANHLSLISTDIPPTQLLA